MIRTFFLNLWWTLQEWWKKPADLGAVSEETLATYKVREDEL